MKGNIEKKSFFWQQKVRWTEISAIMVRYGPYRKKITMYLI